MNRTELLAWLETVPEDEPVFVLRAKDNASSFTLTKYTDRCAELGSPDAHIDEVNRFRQSFDMWRYANIDKCKVPD